jgi:glycine betaine/choline ABC-type transport system substrate-binding protein
MARLVGHVTERDMRAMNRAVDVERRDPGEIARTFLATLKARGV